jgi:hypothetical protein
MGSWNDAMLAAGLDADAYRRGPAPSLSSSIAVSRQSQATDTLRPDRPVLGACQRSVLA